MFSTRFTIDIILFYQIAVYRHDFWFSSKRLETLKSFDLGFYSLLAQILNLKRFRVGLTPPPFETAKDFETLPFKFETRKGFEFCINHPF